MNSESKPDLRKPRRKISLLAAWLIMAGVGAVIILICVLNPPRNSFDYWPGAAFLILLGGAIIATIFVGTMVFVGWVSNWRNFKRFLFGCACFATLIALLYAEENWRGKHEWEQFKQEWEAKGETFDTDSVVPQQVPDDQNFAMSPVWIAELRRNYEADPKRAESWYGDKIYSDEVSSYFRLLPMSVTAVVGTNDNMNLPETPGTLGYWAVARMTDLKPWQSYYRNLERTNPSANIAISPKPQTPAEDVLLALSKYDPLIERLRQDSQLPFSRFPIDYNGGGNPTEILVPHLAGIKQAAQVLELRALAELQAGQTDKALEDTKLILRLVDANRDEPMLISHLVRLALLQIALQPIYEGLANHNWSDTQLVDLDSKLARIDFVNDYKFAMRGEMIVYQDGFAEYVRRDPGQLSNASSDTTSSPSLMARVIGNLIPEGWFYQNELHGDRCVEEHYLPVADTNQNIISPVSVRGAEASFQAETRHGSPYNVLERMSDVLLGPAITFAYGQNAANLARVAIGLERYRLAHGGYPDSLDALAPQFIDRLPHDIINGQPLHYEHTANGQFVLYSVGWNEKDDGGAVVMKGKSDHRLEGGNSGVDRAKGDWVWRYPES